MCLVRKWVYLLERILSSLSLLLITSLLINTLLFTIPVFATDIESQFEIINVEVQSKPSILIQQGNNENGIGLYIGLNNIGINDSLSNYDIELDFGLSEIDVLDVLNESNSEEFIQNIDNISGKVKISGLNVETSFSKLIFVPISINNLSNSKVNFSVKFLNLKDKNANSIILPEPDTLIFQRGKIIKDDSVVGISDAVAGLQYLVGLKNENEINLVNMASIFPDNKVDVKDVIVLMQRLVGLID